MIVIELSGNPRGWARTRYSSKTGAFFTPEKMRAYQNTLGWQAREAMVSKPPLDCPVSIRVEAFFPVPASWSKSKRSAALCGALKHTSKPDVDNIIKNCCDAFNAIVWNDDRQVFEGTVVKAYSERPRLRVIVTPVATLQGVTG